MKQEEIIKLSDVQLQDNLIRFRREYATLKMNHAISPLENPVQLRTKRRAIARLCTEMSKRKIVN